jgi:hypothetical protein
MSELDLYSEAEAMSSDNGQIDIFAPHFADTAEHRKKGAGQLFFELALRTDYLGTSFYFSEDAVVELYGKITDREKKALIIAHLDSLIIKAETWGVGAENNCCSLFDESKHKYRHHLCHGVQTLLRLSPFSYISYVPYHVWHLLLHGEYRIQSNFKSRDFRSLRDIAKILIEQMGLYCRGCNCTHHYGKDDVYLQLRDNDRWCDGDPLAYWWEFGVCKSCWELAKARARLNYANRTTIAQAVDAWCALDWQVRYDIRKRAETPVWPKPYAYVFTDPVARTTKGKIKQQPKKLKVAKLPSKSQPKLGKRSRLWKAAYDALREMGIDIESIERNHNGQH